MTIMVDQKIQSVSGILLDNPGELAKMSSANLNLCILQLLSNRYWYYASTKALHSCLFWSIFQIVPQFWLSVLVPLHSSLPGASKSFLVQFSFWCPVVSHECDVVEFSSKHLCNTSPSPLMSIFVLS